jgi:hypothetical protein
MALKQWREAKTLYSKHSTGKKAPALKCKVWQSFLPDKEAL